MSDFIPGFVIGATIMFIICMIAFPLLYEKEAVEHGCAQVIESSFHYNDDWETIREAIK